MEFNRNASLKPYVTFGVDATCDHLYHIEDIDELQLALRHLENPLILGGGSNVLPVGDIHRNVIRVALKGIDLEERTGHDPLVHIAAGELWHHVVLWTLDHELGGIENMSLIPGTAGAAPIQNIGAYGVELDSVFDSLEAMRIGDGQLVHFSKDECRFGYRDSIFKNESRDQYVITKVVIRLQRNHVVNTSYGAIQDVLREKNIDKPSIRDVSNAVISIRQSKLPDPSVIGNAGSFFKNPVISKEQYEQIKMIHHAMPGFPVNDSQMKVPAGWLIEHAGWKGRSIGNAGSYEHQALVIVNRGGATGEEIWAFAMQVMESVKDQFGILLQPEVNVWK